MFKRASVSKVVAGLLVLKVGGLPLLADNPAGGYEWMPAEAEAGELRDQAPFDKAVISEIVETKIPKLTADLSTFTREYVIDLKKFGISNEGANPEETTRGLNAALQDARATGANRIVFPKGTYLVSDKETIVFNHQDTVVDLNGATIQMVTNGNPDYVMIRIADEARNFRLTNGTLRGDRETHDYQTIKSTHEGCLLLFFGGGSELEIDRIVFADCPGYTIATSNRGGEPGREGLLKLILDDVNLINLQPGAFSPTGETVEDPTRIRTITPYEIARSNGEFEFGWTGGYMGFPIIKSRQYQTVFYDADMKFLQKQENIQYKKVRVPQGGKYAHFEFNQPNATPDNTAHGISNATYCGRITIYRPPSDVHFHSNTIVNNRSLGFAFTGGFRWIIENNHFERNGGQAPSYAFDFEDGWDMMQSIILRKNIFKGNRHDLVVCAGTEILIEDNQFESTVVAHGRAFNYTFRKNHFKDGRVTYATRTGVAKIHDNRYEDSKELIINFDGKGVADGFVREPGQNVVTPALELRNETLTNVSKVRGTYFKLIDSKVDNVHFIAGKETVLAWFENCDVNESTLTYEVNGPTVLVRNDEKNGNVREEGPGIQRRSEISKK